MLSLIQFLPILLLVAASLFNRPGEPAFSYVRDGAFRHQVRLWGSPAWAGARHGAPAAPLLRRLQACPCHGRLPLPPVQLETQRLAVPYFVKSAEQHERQYAPGSRARAQLELEVESAFYEHVQSRWAAGRGGGGRSARARARALVPQQRGAPSPASLLLALRAPLPVQLWQWRRPGTGARCSAQLAACP